MSFEPSPLSAAFFPSFVLQPKWTSFRASFCIQPLTYTLFSSPKSLSCRQSRWSSPWSFNSRGQSSLPLSFNFETEVNGKWFCGGGQRMSSSPTNCLSKTYFFPLWDLQEFVQKLLIIFCNFVTAHTFIKLSSPLFGYFQVLAYFIQVGILFVLSISLENIW